MRSRGGSSVRSSHLGTSPGTAAPCRTLGGLIKNPSPAVPEPEQPLRGPQRELSPRGCRDRRLRSLVPVPVPAGEEGRRGKEGEGGGALRALSTHPCLVPGMGLGAELPGFPRSLDPTSAGHTQYRGWGHRGDGGVWSWGQGLGRIQAKTSVKLLTLPTTSISCCIWAILDRSCVNFTKMLLTCCLTCTMIKPKGGIDLISLTVGVRRGS